MAVGLPLAASIGSLVSVRNRDWVVVGNDGPDVLLLRPLSGSSEITGIYLPLEPVRPAHFPDPDPSNVGDATGISLLFDAARLSIRNGAAPFRLLAHISVDPRAYQFVPLIMALRQPQVRLMIADDVGVGKTIEAGMIARELIDRGRVKRTAVVCPAHLTRQWGQELQDKFGIDARVVQPSTIGRLNRELPRPDLSLYQYYAHTVVSVDWIKSDANAPQFLRDAPDLVIIDEAHICARPPGGSGRSQHQRYNFLKALAERCPHIVLVTATPHSGIDSSFRSLIGLLNPDLDEEAHATPAQFGMLTSDLELRDRLKRHIVLRRRRDLEHWLDQDTPFPDRQLEVVSYHPSEAYLALYDDVVRYCRESIQTGKALDKRRQRVRFWAATAILRCVLSSPAAAQSVLENRASGRKTTEPTDTDSADDADVAFRGQVLDPTEDGEASDFAPTAPLDEANADVGDTERRRLMVLGRRAGALAGAEHDVKLGQVGKLVIEMLRTGHSPIVFCRYIATASYLEAELPKLLFQRRLGNARVRAVTGEVGDDERRQRVEELGSETLRVLVATDCLSEGINLQEHFDAVIHYDLPWNPNRLEQRDGRVDRFGQPQKVVRSVRLVGRGTAVDEIVNSKLLEKSLAIRKQLGVTVPVPGDATGIAEAIVDSVLLSGSGAGGQAALQFEDPKLEELDKELERAVEREEEIRSFFRTPIEPGDVQNEIVVSQAVLGDPAAIERFVREGAIRFGGKLNVVSSGIYRLESGDLKSHMIARGCPDPMTLTFQAVLGAEGKASFAGRTHPAVETLADTILGQALSPDGSGDFPRCGAIFTSVDRRTALALARIRYLLSDESEEYAEEIVLAAFQQMGSDLHWLDGDIQALLSDAHPVANMPPEEKQRQCQWALDTLHNAGAPFGSLVEARVRELESANNRLRSIVSGSRLSVEPHLPPDLIAVCVLVPSGQVSISEDRGGI